MNITPIRHMLFLTVLLFIILSSGSLQCALNCYDRASQYSPSAALAADCHPLAIERLTQGPASNFCHYGHTPSEIEKEPTLKSISNGQLLALFTSRPEAPEYRCSDPFIQTVAVLSFDRDAHTEILPLSQSLKQLRSTILLM